VNIKLQQILIQKKEEFFTNLRKLKSSYEEKKLIDNEINSLRSKVDTLKQEDVSKGAASEEEGDKKKLQQLILWLYFMNMLIP